MTLKGKNCLITGASAGLGLVVSKLFGSQGANTILLCRNKEKGEFAVSAIKKVLQNASVDLMICDLASMKSIRHFINEFREKYSILDILYNNAAVMKQKRTTTEDGFEMMFQVNYLAPFVLMNAFRELLKKSSSPRIINIARPEYKVRLDMNDIQFSKKYSMWTSFFVTKLYFLFAGLEFSRRYAGDNISVMMIDPARRAFKSELVRDVPLVGWFKNLFSVPVEGAAGNILFHAISDDAMNKNGKVFKGKQEWPLCEYWQDTSIGKRLWSVTESLLNNV